MDLTKRAIFVGIRKSPSITHRWRKYIAVGCSHGHLIDPKSRAAVLKFKAEYRPDKIIHLGDFTDMTALRGGAGGTKDEAQSIGDDLKAGLGFLAELEPRLIFMGNHEDRISRFQDHPNAFRAFVAGQIIGQLHDLCGKLRAELVPYDIDDGWRMVGDHLFGHGYMYNEMAIRDHAELVGNCIIAHLHRTGEERGRRRGGATGYCVGLLGDIKQLCYAKTHKATLKWANAFAYGEYCDNGTTVNLCKRADNGAWRLP